MDNILKFSNRNEFDCWLQDNCSSDEGVWLLFGKVKGPKTISAKDALEVALCNGWIDGKMQSLDEFTYKKYFAKRRKNSKWSTKNKGIVAKLEKQGLMKPLGIAKIEEAKQNGQWDTQESLIITEDDIASLHALLDGHEPAYTNFQSMSASVKKTYARAYYDAKTDAGRTNRLKWMMDRLDKNLKPM